MNTWITIGLFLIFLNTTAQDTCLLKIHFLYGSKPYKKYKDTEQKWFGGIWGGHVGIETDSGKILSFVPDGKFHWFSKRNNRHSRYTQHSFADFYSILGGHSEDVKKAIVYVPVTIQQKQKFDSIASVYLKHTPYDYAFIGMRCAAATYEILGQLMILPSYSSTKTFRKIFYPAKLRSRLLEKAFKNNWKILIEEGSFKRKWEKD